MMDMSEERCMSQGQVMLHHHHHLAGQAAGGAVANDASAVLSAGNVVGQGGGAVTVQGGTPAAASQASGLAQSVAPHALQMAPLATAASGDATGNLTPATVNNQQGLTQSCQTQAQFQGHQGLPYGHGVVQSQGGGGHYQNDQRYLPQNAQAAGATQVTHGHLLQYQHQPIHHQQHNNHPFALNNPHQQPYSHNIHPLVPYTALHQPVLESQVRQVHQTNQVQTQPAQDSHHQAQGLVSFQQPSHDINPFTQYAVPSPAYAGAISQAYPTTPVPSSASTHSSADFNPYTSPQYYTTPATPLSPQSINMAGWSAEELSQMQELSNRWEPAAEGPLVSKLLPSSALTQEYANADPVFQAKTASLPQKYAQYRTCRGDGHCGWRAIAFSYFESLIRNGDKLKFIEEETRLRSLENIMKDVGLGENIFDEFIGPSVDLLRLLPTLPDSHAELMATFNDEDDRDMSQSIIFGFKVLTSAWIQKNRETYEPFVAPLSVQAYCKTRIEPSVTEIEHVGLTALGECVLQPAGISMEILYLDRSAGDEVNVYEFPATDHSGVGLTNAPTIHLLYRPGHYDILYKPNNLPTVSPGGRTVPVSKTDQEVLVALNHGQTEHFHVKLPYEVNDFEIPGMATFPTSQIPGSLAWNAFGEFPMAQESLIPIQPLPSTSPTETAAAVTPFPSLPSNQLPELYSTASGTSTAPQAVSSTPASAGTAPPVNYFNGLPFRSSKWEYESSMTSPTHNPASCQTAIFKNSHYNPAHFNNPDFEPEQWLPESDYAPSDKPRKKSTSN